MQRAYSFKALGPNRETILRRYDQDEHFVTKRQMKELWQICVFVNQHTLVTKSKPIFFMMVNYLVVIKANFINRVYIQTTKSLYLKHTMV